MDAYRNLGWGGMFKVVGIGNCVFKFLVDKYSVKERSISDPVISGVLS